MPDSDDGRIVDLMLYGKSSQQQYSGKNLLDLRDGNGYDGEGVFYARNANGSYTRTGTATGSTGNVWFAGGYGQVGDIQTLFTLKPGIYTVKDCYIFNGQAPYSDTFVVETSMEVTGIRNPPQVAGTTYSDIIYPRVLAGDTDTGWEPYVGGIPSPNPEYPQEIKAVVNPSIKVCGKNLIDCTLKTGTKYGATYTKLDVGGRYSVSGVPTNQSGVPFFDGELDAGTYTISCTVESGSVPGNINVAIVSSIIARCKFENGSVTFTLSKKQNVTLWNDYGSYSSELSATFAIQIEKGSTATDYEPYTETSAKLPYTLNAIPVSSGGNIIVGGQQYIADYIDVEKGKLVRMVDSSKLNTTQSIIDKTEWALDTPTETDLTADEITALKGLASYYPTTNVAVSSDQLDGHVIFDYPISLAKGYDYLKAQLGDTRDYVYNLDLMTAEAYVNSEYAAALAEIEV